MHAGDLAKVILLQGPGQYKSATAKAAVDSVALSTAALTESLGPAGIAQNTQKNRDHSYFHWGRIISGS